MSIKEPVPPKQPLFIPPDAPEPDPEIQDIPDPFMPKTIVDKDDYVGPYNLELTKRARGTQADDQKPKPKRKRGGQPGNHNRLVHGLYIQNSHVRNTNPIEKSALYDLSDHIKYVKDYMRFLFEKGLKAASIYESNDTMRSLSMASLSVCRLITTHNIYSSIPLPAEMMRFDDTEPTFDELMEEFKAQDPRMFKLINEEP